MLRIWLTIIPPYPPASPQRSRATGPVPVGFGYAGPDRLSPQVQLRGGRLAQPRSGQCTASDRRDRLAQPRSGQCTASDRRDRLHSTGPASARPQTGETACTAQVRPVHSLSRIREVVFGDILSGSIHGSLLVADPQISGNCLLIRR